MDPWTSIRRLRIAMKNNEDFRVVVVLPVFPAGDLVRLSSRASKVYWADCIVRAFV
jgi:hypothetical protein